MRRARRPADAVGPGVDLAHGGGGGEGGLDGVFEVEGELEIAELAGAVIGERRERGEHLGGGAAARADDLPAQLEEAGADGGEADSEHGAPVFVPAVGELEGADPRDVDVVAVAHQGDDALGERPGVGARLGGASVAALRSAASARCKISTWTWLRCAGGIVLWPAAIDASICSMAAPRLRRVRPLMTRTKGPSTPRRGSSVSRTVTSVPPPARGSSV